MEWVVNRTNPIFVADLDTAYVKRALAENQADDFKDKAHQLYSALMQMTEGQACNSSSDVLEAWRKLAPWWDLRRTDQKFDEILDPPWTVETLLTTSEMQPCIQLFLAILEAHLQKYFF